jgi:hypothetical protein
MELTEVEKQIIEILREIKPFEHVDIIKDQTGKVDCYVVHRSQKVIILRTT